MARHGFNMDKSTGLALVEWIKRRAPQLKQEHLFGGFAEVVMEIDDVEAVLAFSKVGNAAERRRFAMRALERIAAQGLTYEDGTPVPRAYDPTTPEGRAEIARRLKEQRAEEDELYRLMTEAERQEQPTEGTAGRRRRSQRSS